MVGVDDFVHFGGDFLLQSGEDLFDFLDAFVYSFFKDELPIVESLLVEFEVLNFLYALKVEQGQSFTNDLHGFFDYFYLVVVVFVGLDALVAERPELAGYANVRYLVVLMEWAVVINGRLVLGRLGGLALGVKPVRVFGWGRVHD